MQTEAMTWKYQVCITIIPVKLYKKEGGSCQHFLYVKRSVYVNDKTYMRIQLYLVAKWYTLLIIYCLVVENDINSIWINTLIEMLYKCYKIILFIMIYNHNFIFSISHLLKFKCIRNQPRLLYSEHYFAIVIRITINILLYNLIWTTTSCGVYCLISNNIIVYIICTYYKPNTDTLFPFLSSFTINVYFCMPYNLAYWLAESYSV